ncbi:WXG100 family type VII secretion target [Nonomuraea sp. B1E8]|uniref:WXG100 family type VII secretion target n=1 Tax=unclassified Nonomuraea TaxID=2593643 RepID=UPI00325D3F51
MGQQRGVVTILSFDRTPQGAWVDKDKSEIKALLQNTDSFTIETTGQTYQDAASKIEQAINALEAHAGKIADVWKGPDAARARTALELLHATGNELSSKLSMMGAALQTYAGHLNDTKTQVDEEVSVPSAGLTQQEEDLVREGLENTQAQRALYELNQKIVSIYDIDLPHSVSYDLPAVTIPSGPAETQEPDYRTGPGTEGPAFTTPVNDDGGSYDGGSRVSNTSTGGTGSGSPSGSSEPQGSDRGDSDPRGSDPGGSNPGGSDPGDPTNPGPDTPADPGTDPPASQDPGGQDPGSENGATAPPVIGADDTTTTDGTNPTDPRQTDMAGYQPPTATIAPPTVTTPSTTLNPQIGYNLPTTGGTPGIPSVIGSPAIGGGQSPLVTPLGRGSSTGMAGGMPFMPFMGGGVGGGEYSDLERNTYVPEDANCWTVGHDTTDPVIE